MGRERGRGGVAFSLPRTWKTCRAEETEAIGRLLAKELAAPCILCLHGDLGAGKTTLIKGLVSEATGCPIEEVCSPTFTYMIPYEGSSSIFHFDLYRLDSPEEFCDLGFDELLDHHALCCIEWPERLGRLLPTKALHLSLYHEGSDHRRIELRGEYGTP